MYFVLLPVSAGRERGSLIDRCIPVVDGIQVYAATIQDLFIIERKLINVLIRFFKKKIEKSPIFITSAVHCTFVYLNCLRGGKSVLYAENGNLDTIMYHYDTS